MCLSYTIKTHPGYMPKVAKKNIICYKILIEDEEGKYSSPIYNKKKWEIGKTYTNKQKRCDFAGAVYGGFYHTYVNKEKAKEASKRCHGNKSHVVKCIIPKGTMYFVGNVNYSRIRGYASRTLKIEEILK